MGRKPMTSIVAFGQKPQQTTLPNIAMTESFNFDTWVRLASLDPCAFEEARHIALEKVLATVGDKETLQCLQCRVDGELLRAKTPLQACLRLSDMMLDKFSELLIGLMQFATVFEGTVILEKEIAVKSSPLATASAEDLLIQNHAVRRILLVDDEPINRELSHRTGPPDQAPV